MPAQFQNQGIRPTGFAQKDAGMMGGINSALMGASAPMNSLTASMGQAPNPQKGTPSGARSFLNSGAGANGLLNVKKKVLGQSNNGGFGG